MRILITGGSGFIAGNLAKYFSEQGHHIKLASRDINETVEIQNNNKIELGKIIWNNFENLLNICSNIDVVIHAAGLNSKSCQSDPISALEINGVNTAKLIDAAINNNVKKFIFLSTIHVYKDQLDCVLDEDYFPINFHPYATSKRAGENVVIDSYLNHKIDGYVFRISNTFGIPSFNELAGQKLVINELCRNSIFNNQLQLNSSGVQIRNFIPVTEFLNIVDFLLKKNNTNLIRHWNDNIINIGSNNFYSIIEISKLIQERTNIIFGRKPEILIKEVSNSILSNNKFHFKIKYLLSLGYRFKYDFISELDNLLLYHNSCIKNEN